MPPRTGVRRPRTAPRPVPACGGRNPPSVTSGTCPGRDRWVAGTIASGVRAGVGFRDAPKQLGVSCSRAGEVLRAVARRDPGVTAAPWRALHSSGCRRDTDPVAGSLAARGRAGGSASPPRRRKPGTGRGDYRVPGQGAFSFPTRKAGEGQAASRFTVLRRDSGEGSGTERAAFGFPRVLSDDGFGDGSTWGRRGEKGPGRLPGTQAHAAPTAAPGGPPDPRAPTRWWPPRGRSSPRLELYGRGEAGRAGR